jgi:2-isopropylmalate synthase
MAKKQIQIYDTTLRDGEQAEGISYSLEDKVLVAHLLDDFGVQYVEGGQAQSNPKVMEFYKTMRKQPLKNAKLATFGMTRRKDTKVEEDSNLITMLQTRVPVITLVGKSWDLHVTKGLRTTLEENLAMIAESVRYLKKKGHEVVYDAEHFFDGYKANPDYALKTLAAAAEAGADCLTLCETNGGTLPHEVAEIVAAVRRATATPIGIHAHNDAGLAVANSLMAVVQGATQVQGTVNGYGERAGNADLMVIIPNIMLKLGLKAIPPKHLKRLTQFSHTIAEIANETPNPRQPYVGRCSFAHKGGMHVSALQRDQSTYEHISPETVGNTRRVLISELSGRSNIQYKLAEQGMDFQGDSEQQKVLLERVKQMENEGYAFEGAEASFQVLARRLSDKYRRQFQFKGFRVIVEKRGTDGDMVSEATVKVEVNGRTYLTVGEGDGPINALDVALRRGLETEFPQLADVRLLDYKVRVLEGREGTAAKVRVLIESGDGKSEWNTVGVSENIIEASWRALVDSLEYKLMKKA